MAKSKWLVRLKWFVLSLLPFYLLQVALALDQLGNSLTFGMADETLSSRTWRNRNKNRFWKNFHRLIDGIFRILFRQQDHCYKSYLSEKRRKHLPLEFSLED